MHSTRAADANCHLLFVIKHSLVHSRRCGSLAATSALNKGGQCASNKRVESDIYTHSKRVLPMLIFDTRCASSLSLVWSCFECRFPWQEMFSGRFQH